MDLSATVWGAGAAAVLFVLCWLGERRPRHFGDVRLFPYIPVMMACLVVLLVLLAHLISLVTGQPVGR